MIVRPRPSFLHLLFILRGSIVPQIAPKVLAILVVSCLALAAQLFKPGLFEQSTIAPFTLVGLALSIFLSFRNSASYDRWWEARKLWGQMIFEVRSLMRMLGGMALAGADAAHREAALRCLVGFASALEARLRSKDQAAALAPWIGEQDPAAATAPQAALLCASRALLALRRSDCYGDAYHAHLEERLHGLNMVQTACERIMTTPLPFAYTLLMHRTAYGFCLLLPFGLVGALGWWTPIVAAMVAYTLFGLDALGEELEDPFSTHQNGLPLSAMVRTVEIEVLTALGVQDLPAPLQPIDHVLL